MKWSFLGRWAKPLSLALGCLAVPVIAYGVQLYFATFGYTLFKKRVYDEKRIHAVDIVVCRGKYDSRAYIPALGVVAFLGPGVYTDAVGPKGRIHLEPDDDSANAEWDSIALKKEDEGRWVIQWGMAASEQWDVPPECVKEMTAEHRK